MGRTELNVRNRINRRKRLAADPELQEKINARQRERFADPEYRAKMNALKRQWRAERKAKGLPRM